MRNKKLLIIGALLLAGCSGSNEKPVLELTTSRVQIDVNAKFNYLDYIKSATDEEDGDLKEKVEVGKVDTSQVGQQTVEFKLTDSDDNSVSQKLKIDVVHFFKDGIYNPEDVDVEVVKDPNDVTVIINKLYELPKGWTPNDLEVVVDSKYRKLRKEANAAFTEFYNAAKAKNIEIYSISGYREAEQQVTYWENQVKVYGVEYASQYSAYPRRSEHELGLAIDVSYKETGDRLSESVADTPLGKFIVSDAYKYGFVLRYPKDKVAITNYGYEPWHIRYVGKDLAKTLHDQGLTLEEYYN